MRPTPMQRYQFGCFALSVNNNQLSLTNERNQRNWWDEAMQRHDNGRKKNITEFDVFAANRTNASIKFQCRPKWECQQCSQLKWRILSTSVHIWQRNKSTWMNCRVIRDGKIEIEPIEASIDASFMPQPTEKINFEMKWWFISFGVDTKEERLKR